MRVAMMAWMLVVCGCGTEGDGILRTGCELPENWVCSGDATTCTAACDNRFGVTCSQGWAGGPCVVSTYGSMEGDACGIPAGAEGCDMCLDAVTSTCAAFIDP